MDEYEFREHGKEMIDYIANHLSTLNEKKVAPNVEPGFLVDALPSEAPKAGEDWESIFGDVNKLIMPGMTHWQHPRFHAFFPAGNSYPSLLGDLLGNALGCIGFAWSTSPSCTELEMKVMDWLAKMIDLPGEFLHENNQGGGVLQGSASDCIFLSILAAKQRIITKMTKETGMSPTEVQGKLVAYCSAMAHSSVQKGGHINGIIVRRVQPKEYSLDGEELRAAIEKDEREGYIPFYACSTLGTTELCAFDDLRSIGEVCEERGMWLHVDGAYAGNAMICPEYQHILRDGVQYMTSLDFNLNKWMLVNFDCSCFWVRDKRELTNAFDMDPNYEYLKHEHQDKTIDFSNWSLPLSRRFRSLKVWFVLRSYGVEGLQEYIRNHVRLARMFNDLVLEDDRFRSVSCSMGLATFAVQEGNSMTKLLCETLNASQEILLTPGMVKGLYIIRFCISSPTACEDDILTAWDIIQATYEELLAAGPILDSVLQEPVEEEMLPSDTIGVAQNRRKSVVNVDRAQMERRRPSLVRKQFSMEKAEAEREETRRKISDFFTLAKSDVFALDEIHRRARANWLTDGLGLGTVEEGGSSSGDDDKDERGVYASRHLEELKSKYKNVFTRRTTVMF